MPFTPPPQTPNFEFPVGRIATDRYDFEAHLEGTNPPYATNFRHNATQVDLFPTLVIDGITATTVQQALTLLNEVGPGAVPQATVGTSLTNLGVVTLGGDFGGTALIPKVTGIRGFPVNGTPPTVNYVLTWNGSSWGPAPAAGGGFTAGRDLSGTSTSQTVIGIQGNPVSSAAPTTGQFLGWNGSNWIPTTASGTFTAGGDLTGSSTVQTVIGLQTHPVASAAPTSGQALIWSGSSWTPTTLTGSFTANGDLSGSGSSQEVIGLLNHALPSPLVAGYLNYTGSAWALTAISGSFTPGSDLLGNSTSTSTNQYVSALSFSSSASGGAIAVNGTTTSLNWVSNNVTLQKSSTTLAQLGTTTTDFVRFGATPGTNGFIRATGLASIIGINGSSILGQSGGGLTYLNSPPGSNLNIGSPGAQNVNISVGSTTIGQFGILSSDFLAFGATPGADGFIRATLNSHIISVDGNVLLRTDAAGNGYLSSATGQVVFLENGSTIVAELGGLATDFVSLGTDPPTSGMIRVGTGVSGASLPLNIITANLSGGATELIGLTASGMFVGLGNGSAGTGATLNLAAQDAGGTANVGGSVRILSGQGSTSGASGNIQLITGAATGNVGNIIMQPGGSTITTWTASGTVEWAFAHHSGDPSALGSASWNWAFTSGGSAISVASSSTVTLTAAQAATPVIALTGAIIAGGCTIVVPNNIGAMWWFDFTNVTFASAAVTFTTGSGTTFSISAPKSAGMNLVMIAVPASHVISAG